VYERPAHGPVAFAAAGASLAPDASTTYDEPTAATTGLTFDPGWQLMRWFLDRR
jgi:2,3-bisphosphoglycerate-independent phosphoglycerate mutase